MIGLLTDKEGVSMRLAIRHNYLTIAWTRELGLDCLNVFGELLDYQATLLLNWTVFVLLGHL